MSVAVELPASFSIVTEYVDRKLSNKTRFYIHNPKYFITNFEK